MLCVIYPETQMPCFPVAPKTLSLRELLITYRIWENINVKMAFLEQGGNIYQNIAWREFLQTDSGWFPAFCSGYQNSNEKFVGMNDYETLCARSIFFCVSVCVQCNRLLALGNYQCRNYEKITRIYINTLF